MLGLRAGLPLGGAAPDFDLMDETGVRHALKDYRGRWLALFFYPQDLSPVCLAQACSFNDHWQEFRDLGADVLGCSDQDAESHGRMRAACRLNYRLLSDPGGRTRRAWKVPRMFGLGPGRSTYLVDPGSAVRFACHDPLRAERHPTLALAFLRDRRPTPPKAA